AEGRQARSGGCPRAGYSAQPLVQVGTGWRAQGGPSLSWQWATQGQPGRVVCAAARECAAEGRERDFKKSGGVLRARIAVKYAWITAQSGAPDARCVRRWPFRRAATTRGAIASPVPGRWTMHGWCSESNDCISWRARPTGRNACGRDYVNTESRAADTVFNGCGENMGSRASSAVATCVRGLLINA